MLLSVYLCLWFDSHSFACSGISVLLLHVRKETDGRGALGKQSEEVETTGERETDKGVERIWQKGACFFHVRGVGIQDILCPTLEGS